MPIQWNQIGANFNDANSAMRNATEGISKAGTIFGELRRQIIEEEQKAIDNAYREKAFNENVRQFNEQSAFSREKENTRINEWNKEFNADQQYKNNQLALERARLAATNANIGLERQRLAAQIDEINSRNNNNRALNQAHIDWYNRTSVLDSRIQQLEGTLKANPNNTTINQELNTLKAERSKLGLTATENNDWIVKRAFTLGYSGRMPDTMFTDRSKAELNAYNESLKNKRSIESKFKEEDVKALSYLNSLSYDNAKDKQILLADYEMLKSANPNVSPSAILEAIKSNIEEEAMPFGKDVTINRFGIGAGTGENNKKDRYNNYRLLKLNTF